MLSFCRKQQPVNGSRGGKTFSSLFFFYFFCGVFFKYTILCFTLFYLCAYAVRSNLVFAPFFALDFSCEGEPHLPWLVISVLTLKLFIFLSPFSQYPFRSTRVSVFAYLFIFSFFYFRFTVFPIFTTIVMIN